MCRRQLNPLWSHKRIPEEDRMVLLDRKNSNITRHCSAAELGKLIGDANRISATDSRRPALTILRRMPG